MEQYLYNRKKKENLPEKKRGFNWGFLGKIVMISILLFLGSFSISAQIFNIQINNNATISPSDNNIIDLSETEEFECYFLYSYSEIVIYYTSGWLAFNVELVGAIPTGYSFDYDDKNHKITIKGPTDSTKDIYLKYENNTLYASFTSFGPAYSVNINETGGTYCLGGTISLNAAVTANAADITSDCTYKWYYNDGSGYVLYEDEDSESLTFPVGTRTGSINFKVEVFDVGNNKIAESAPIAFTGGVNCSPSATPALSVPDGIISLCGNVNMPTITADPGLANCISSEVTYKWYKNTGSGYGPAISGANSATLSFPSTTVATAAGTYKFEVTLNSTSTVIGSQEITISAIQAPATPVITYTPLTSNCAGGKITFNITGGAIPGYTYQWYNGSTPVGTSSGSYEFTIPSSTTAEIYNIKAEASVCGGTPVASNPVAIQALASDDEACTACTPTLLFTETFGTETTGSLQTTQVTLGSTLVSAAASGYTQNGYKISNSIGAWENTAALPSANTAFLFSNYQNDGTVYTPVLQIKDVSADNAFYLLTFDVANISLYEKTSLKIYVGNNLAENLVYTGSATVQWDNIPPKMVSGQQLRDGFNIIIYGVNNTRVAIDNIILSSVCPPKVSLSVTEGNHCIVDDQLVKTVLTATVDPTDANGPYTYTWYKDGGTTPIQTTTATASKTDTYTVTTTGEATYSVVVKNKNSAATNPLARTLYCNPFISGATAPQTFFCTGDNIDFTFALNPRNGYTAAGYALYEEDGTTLVNFSNIASACAVPGPCAGQSLTFIPDGTTASGKYKLALLYFTGSVDLTGMLDADIISNATRIDYTSDFTLTRKLLCDATPTIEGSQAYCGSNVTLTATPGATIPGDVTVTYEWQQLISGSYASLSGTGNQVSVGPGTYRVKAHIVRGDEPDDSGWSATTIESGYTVTAVPFCSGAGVTIGSDINANGYCPGKTINFNIASLTGVNTALINYQWYVDGEETGQTGNTFAFTAGAATSYNIKLRLISKSNPADYRESEIITIHQSFFCGTTVSLSSSKSMVCDGGSVSFTATLADFTYQSDVTYSYTITAAQGVTDLGTVASGTFTSSPFTTDAVAALTGTDRRTPRKFAIKITATKGELTNEIVSTNEVIVSQLPNVQSITITPSSSTNLCPTSGFTLTASPGAEYESETFTYEWKKDGVTQSATSNTLTGYVGNVKAGGYTYTATVTGGACNNGVSGNATITPKSDCALFTTSATLDPETGNYKVRFCDGSAMVSVSPTSLINTSGMNITYSWCGVDSENKTTQFNSSMGNISSDGKTFTAVKEGTYRVDIYLDYNPLSPSSPIATFDFNVADFHDCMQNYYVWSASTATPKDGSSWSNAFTTLNAALAAAKTVTEKKVNVYMAKGESQAAGTTNNTLNNDISILGGYDPDNNTVSTTGRTIITGGFKIGKGTVILKNLTHDGADFAVANATEGTGTPAVTITNDLTIENSDFTKAGGAVKMNNSGRGGNLKVIDCTFDGDKSTTSGVAVNGPYFVEITSTATTAGEPMAQNVTYTPSDLNNCINDPGITMNLSDTTATGVDDYMTIFKNFENAHTVDIQNAANVLISKVLFSKNGSTNSGGAAYGTALNIETAVSSEVVTKVTIEKSYFVDNQVRGRGNVTTILEGAGVLYLSNISDAYINHCVFRKNHVGLGNGGAFAADKTNLTLTNNYFIDNYISADGSGGAFYVLNATLININDNWFEHNCLVSGTGKGGGIYVGDAVVNVTNTLFYRNVAGQSGGAFYSRGKTLGTYDSNSLIKLDKCLFSKNTACSGDGTGGAICVQDLNLDISDTYFYQNTSMEEGTAPVTVINSYLKVFSSTFYKNGSSQKSVGAITVAGHPACSTTQPNAYIYNSTFTENYGGGNDSKGIIYITDQVRGLGPQNCGAYADIVSCTMVNNTAGYYAVSGQAGLAGSGIITETITVGAKELPAVVAIGTGKCDILNTIIAGNTKSPTNTASADAISSTVNNLGYNTIGSSSNITGGYAVNCAATTCDTRFTPCTGSFVAADLIPICIYSPGMMSPTMPFGTTATCPINGMPVSALKAHAAGNIILEAELLKDQHGSPRGWKSECPESTVKCDDNDLPPIQTFRGAVESVGGDRQVKTFDINVLRQVALCTGGSLSAAYIEVSVYPAIGEKTFITENLKDYSITVMEDGEIYSDYNKKPLEGVISAVNGKRIIHLDNVPAGTYEVHVYRTTNQEEHYQPIVVEKISETNLVWIGGTGGDFNDISNWKYANPDGTVAAGAGAVVAKPSKCFDVHIGLKNPETKNPVANLPAISTETISYSEIKGAGECRDVHFHPGGSLGHVNRLNYNRAFVDMELDGYNKETISDPKWYMIAPPLKEMYSGDYAASGLNVFIRYFTAAATSQTDGTYCFEGTWNNSIYDADVTLSVPTMGYGFRYYTRSPIAVKDTHIFSFPVSTTQHTYASGATSQRAITKTDYKYRFILENDKNEFKEDTDVEISFIDGKEHGLNINEKWNTELSEMKEAVEEETAGGYIIVGNPYMSHLDLKAFYEDNADAIYPCIKTKVCGAFPSCQITDSELKLTGDMTQYLAPMQAFFVRPKKPGAEKLTLKFNAATQSTSTTVVGSELRGLQADENNLTLQATTNDGVKSMTVFVKAQPGAKMGFYVYEDIQKLFSNDFYIDMYTYAGKVAADLNVVNSDSLSNLYIPVGIRAKNAGKVTLSFTGASGFTAAENIWLVDNLKQTRTSLLQQETFEVDLAAGTTEGRFYLYFEPAPAQLTDAADPDASRSLFIGSLDDMLTVSSVSEKILDVAAFDLSSKLIFKAQGLSTDYYTHRLPNLPAVYLIRVVTDKQVTTKKIIVK